LTEVSRTSLIRALRSPPSCGSEAPTSANTKTSLPTHGARAAPRAQFNTSYLESCIRAYIGGATNPLYLSSGLEDYFLGTYYFNKGLYYTPVAGLTHLDKERNEFSAYRFHEDDPVFFHRGLRLTCRCGETLNGKGLWDPPQTQYTTYVWLYQW